MRNKKLRSGGNTREPKTAKRAEISFHQDGISSTSGLCLGAASASCSSLGRGCSASGICTSSQERGSLGGRSLCFAGISAGEWLGSLISGSKLQSKLNRPVPTLAATRAARKSGPASLKKRRRKVESFWPCTSERVFSFQPSGSSGNINNRLPAGNSHWKKRMSVVLLRPRP